MMDSDQSSEKKEKKGFFSLRRSFSGRSASGQDFEGSDTGSITNGQDLASPFSDKSARRASAPSALMAVDENTSDLGSEIGGSGLPKKSKMFSTKFVKKMFKKSGSTKGSDAGGDIGSPDGVSVADEDELMDESRMSEASGATGTVDENGSPKKKKRFSMKAVKKIFRSNSMGGSNHEGDTPSVQDSASVADGSEAIQQTPPSTRRKSMFSFGKKSAPPSNEPKGIAALSISSKEESDPYRGPISPTFMGRKPFQDEEDGFAAEESTVKASPQDTPMKEGSVPKSPLGRSAETTSPAAHASSGSGSAWKLFQAVEEEPHASVSASASPGKLEYDLPLQNAGERSADEVDVEEEDEAVRSEKVDSQEEPFEHMSQSQRLIVVDNDSLTPSEQNINTAYYKQDTTEYTEEENVPVFELTIPEDPPASPPSSPPQSHGSKHLSASTLSLDDAIYSPTVTSPQPAYDPSEVESVSSYGKQKKSPSMFSTKTIAKMWRRASLSSPKSPLPVPLPPPAEDSSVSTQSLASSSRSPAPLASASKSPKPQAPPSATKPTQVDTPVVSRERSSSAQRARGAAPAVVQLDFQSSEVDEVPQETSAAPVAASTAAQRTPSPVPKRGSMSPLKGLSSMLRSSVSPKRSKSPKKASAMDVSEEAIAALQEMPPQTALSPEQHTEAPSHEYFESSPAALDAPAKPSPAKRNLSPKPFRARSPEKFIFDITHAVETASKMLSVVDSPVPSEPPQSVFVVEGSKVANGALDDPAVLKICVPSKSEAEVAVLMVPNRTDVPVTVLILRNTGIISPERFCFNLRFPYLTDLDLGWNGIAGAVKGLPPTLQRLDLSHNRITNISTILNCMELKELNLSHNNIKSFHGLPATLERLDLSHNAITAAITLRTLALSPIIKSLDLTGNAVILEVVEWKIMLRNMLTQLDELNGRPLPRPKKAGVVPPLGGRKPSPSKTRASATVREEQRVNDAVRTRMHKMKLDMLKETKEQADKSASAKLKTLRPDEVDHLARRLSAPTKAMTLKAKADPLPPPLFSTRDLAHRKSAQPIPSVVAQHTRTDVSLTDFVTRSKLQVAKAAQLVVRVTQLSNQDVIDRDDIVKLSNALSRLELSSNRDVPLKVEYAIEKLVDGDALKRRVNTVREQMDVVGLLLQQVDSAMLLSAQGAFTLRDALDSAMSSGPGIMTHTSILRSYEASFDPSSFLGARTTNPRASWQPAEPQQQHQQQQQQQYTSVAEDNYFYNGSVKEAQEEFNYRVKDADSRHATPARAPQGSSESTPAAPSGYDENKNDAAPPAVSSEAFMDRVRSRISMRAFYGSSDAAEEAKASSPARMASHKSLVHSAEDDAPPPPPPLDTPESAEAKVVDSKVAAKDRVLARMSSRTLSLSRIDTETPPPPPPPVVEPVQLSTQEAEQEQERDSDIPLEISIPAQPFVAPSEAVDAAHQAAAVEADVDREPLPEEEGDVLEQVQREQEQGYPSESTNDYFDEEINPPVVEDSHHYAPDEQDEQDEYVHVAPQEESYESNAPTTDVYGRSPRSASYYSSTPASRDDAGLSIFSQTEEDEQWRAAQQYAEAEAARASPVALALEQEPEPAATEHAAGYSHRAPHGIAATSVAMEEEVSERSSEPSVQQAVNFAPGPVQPVSEPAFGEVEKFSSKSVPQESTEEARSQLPPLDAPSALEPDADAEVRAFSFSSRVLTPTVDESPRPESAASPTLSDATADSSKMSAKDRILARMAKNKKA